VARAGNELEAGPRDRRGIFSTVIHRHDTVLFSPQEMHGHLDPVQSPGELRVMQGRRPVIEREPLVVAREFQLHLLGTPVEIQLAT